MMTRSTGKRGPDRKQPAAPAPQLRIRGVVRAMNQAREKLKAGLLPDEVDKFRQWVVNVTEAVEAICREHKVAIEDLPAPTYNAYRFLKDIDMEHLPLRSAAPKTAASKAALHREPEPRGPKLRIKNLVSSTASVQAKLAELAQIKGGKRGGTLKEGVAQARARVSELAEQVEQLCREAQALPGDLPDPSRRAYQWVKYLSEEGRIEAHLDALRLAQAAADSAVCRQGLSAAQRTLPVQVEFFHIPVVYRYHRSQTGISITASEAFIYAPQEILTALACAALARRGSPAAKQVMEYADLDEYAEALLALDTIGEATEPSGLGRAYDLERVFDRVNARYFGKKLERPRLTWSRRLTRRKFGHYQFASDTLMISLTLDHPEVPDYVVDFVMYHELLHKALGIQLVNGRRYTHTPAFRKAERRFKQFAEAQEYLNQLAR